MCDWDYDRMTLANNFKNLRERYNLTQQQFARIFGVSWKTYDDYERGWTDCSIEFLFKVSQCYGSIGMVFWLIPCWEDISRQIDSVESIHGSMINQYKISQKWGCSKVPLGSDFKKFYDKLLELCPHCRWLDCSADCQECKQCELLKACNELELKRTTKKRGAKT